MQLEGLTIALRTRAPWEATDLGVTLVRAHARRIWAAWLLTTLPVFGLLNLLGCWLGATWLALLALWWLKPAFDRVPLYVISRAVFGAVPSVDETVRAQWRWGWRALLPWLTWRRLHPGRAMLIPVDLLEGVSGPQRRERVRVLSRAHASPNVMLTIIGAHLEFVLATALVALGLMFVPVEFFSDSVKAVWRTLFDDPPLWAQMLGNAMVWFAMSVIEPFYVGAGFGLYLNRRMQLEAWDIELAFRRLAARLQAPLAAAALLLIALFVAPLHAADLPSDVAPAERGTEQAATPPTEQQAEAKEESAGDKSDAAPKKNAVDLRKLFAGGYRDDGAAFEADVSRVYKDAELSPTNKEFVWRRRHPEEIKAGSAPEWAKPIAAAVAFLAHYALWIALAVVLLMVLANIRRWMPWISARVARAPLPEPVHLRADAEPERLPHDVPSAVRELLRQARVREALALLYRAAVARLIEHLGAPLPPGATESDCLRQARRLSDARYAGLFARIVRCWQAAAYAQRLPNTGEVEALLTDWSAPRETPA